MFKRFLGFILVLVLVLWKWDALKALISRFIDFDRFYEMSIAHPASPVSEETVYVTPGGRRYHRSGCRSLAADVRVMSLGEAKQSYQPCGLCRPSG